MYSQAVRFVKVYKDTDLVNTPSPLLVSRSDRHPAGICPMFPSSPGTSSGSTASTVMGLSQEAEAFVQSMNPSIRDALRSALVSHTGTLFRCADQQLSSFKGELLAHVDDNERAASPTPDFLSGTVPDADSAANNPAATVSPVQSLVTGALASPIRALFSSGQPRPTPGPPADDNIGATEDISDSAAGPGLDDTAILRFQLPSDLFAPEGSSFLSTIISILSSVIQDQLSSPERGRSKNQLTQDHIKAWILKTTSALVQIFDHQATQDCTRDNLMEEISGSQANLSHLSLSGIDPDDDEFRVESANIIRLQTVLKSTDALAQHAHRSAIKALNSDQQFIVFSTVSKTGGFSAAKLIDYGATLNDNEVKAANSASQLITLVSVLKGLISTFPVELCCIIPTLVQIIEERDMEDRTVPTSLAESNSAPGMNPAFYDQYKQMNAALYAVLFRTIPQTLLATHRPHKHTSRQLVRSQHGDAVMSLFIILSKFKKSSFVLRAKFADIFNTAYQKISVVPDITGGLRHLQSFLAEALLVETRIEYETVIRFVNVLRIRDATFSEMATRIIEVSQHQLSESGLHSNALPQFDNAIAEGLELCERYQIGDRPATVNLLVDASSFDRAVLNLEVVKNPGTAAAVSSQSSGAPSNSAADSDVICLQCASSTCKTPLTIAFTNRATSKAHKEGVSPATHTTLCGKCFKQLVILKQVTSIPLSPGKLVNGQPVSSVAITDFQRRDKKPFKSKKKDSDASSSAAAVQQNQQSPDTAVDTQENILVELLRSSIKGKSPAQIEDMISKMGNRPTSTVGAVSFVGTCNALIRCGIKDRSINQIDDMIVEISANSKLPYIYDNNGDFSYVYDTSFEFGGAKSEDTAIFPVDAAVFPVNTAVTKRSVTPTNGTIMSELCSCTSTEYCTCGSAEFLQMPSLVSGDWDYHASSSSEEESGNEDEDNETDSTYMDSDSIIVLGTDITYMPGDSATLPDSGSTESSDMPDLVSDSSSDEEFSDEDEDDETDGTYMLGDTVTLPNGIIMTKEEYMHSWHIFDTGNSLSADASTTAAALDAMIDGGISFVGDSCK